MSKLTAGVLGTIAVSLTFGAVQFAVGRDLSSGAQALSRTQGAAVNRAAKSDRVTGAVRLRDPTQTISLQLNGVSDTSVLVRIPVAQAGRNGSFLPLLPKSGPGASTLACEPVVSVLSEVAKLLPPGRCVT